MLSESNIFNNKVLKRNVNSLQIDKIKDIKEKFNIIEGWKDIIENGKLLKVNESSMQGEFLSQVFVKILGYEIFFLELIIWNIEHEISTYVDSTKPDGVLGFFDGNNKDIRVVIELKGPNTDLDLKQKSRKNQQTPVEQAFSYAPKYGSNYSWIIVSNFIEIRLYYSYSILNYERFYINDLLKESKFLEFYFLLSKNNLIDENEVSIVDRLYIENEEEERKISNEFYEVYKSLRMDISNSLLEYNSNVSELVMLEKAQKILDRIIFICFCQEKDLIPSKTLTNILEVYKLS